MQEKQYSWRRYIALTASILVLLSWVFLYLIDETSNNFLVNGNIFIFIFSLPLSLIFGLLSWFTEKEKKMIVIVSLMIITLVSISSIGFIFWIGWLIVK